jgi:hypothetical protein
MFQDETGWQLWLEPTGKVFLVHDADTPAEKCVTCRVVNDRVSSGCNERHDSCSKRQRGER